MSNSDSVTTAGTIENFRLVSGTSCLYRCAKTDDLADRLEADDLSQAERFVMYDAGLIIDMRKSIVSMNLGDLYCTRSW
jgi:hypothetical protein